MPNDWTRRLGEQARAATRSIKARPQDANPFPPTAPQISRATNPFDAAPGPGLSPFTTAGGSQFGVPGPLPTPLPPPGAIPLPDTPTGAPPVKPVAVHVAYVSLLVAACLTTILAGMGVYGLTQLRQTVDNVVDMDPTGAATLYVTNYVDDTQLYLTAAVAILGVLLAIGYVVVGRAIRKGRRWPRLLCPVLAVLSLPVMFLGHIAPLIVIAGLIATAAAWTPQARRYSLARQRG